MNRLYDEAQHQRHRPGGRLHLSLRDMINRPPHTLGRIGGVEVRVHAVWLVGAPLVGLLAASGRGSLPAAIAYLLLPAVWALSVLAHEAGHALTAARLGHRVESVSLLPMGGATAYDGPPSRARDQILISGAGPAVSLLLAAASLLIGLTVPRSAADWWLQVAAFNGAIFVWNALPALPLDGGRVLHSAFRLSGRDHFTTARDAVLVAKLTAFGLAATAGVALEEGFLAPTVNVMIALALYSAGLMILRFNVISAAPPELAVSRVSDRLFPPPASGAR